MLQTITLLLQGTLSIMVNSGLYNASEEEYVQQVHIRKPGEKDNAPGAILQRDG